MKHIVICIVLSLCSISVWSQSTTSFSGDWKRACNQWDSTTETWVPVIEILRITQSESGAYHIQGKVVNASDGTTRAYTNLVLDSCINNVIKYHEVSGSHVFYHSLSFDGDAAKNVCTHGRYDGETYPINRIDYYYRRQEDW